jgi:hypothetical protein
MKVTANRYLVQKYRITGSLLYVVIQLCVLLLWQNGSFSLVRYSSEISISLTHNTCFASLHFPLEDDSLQRKITPSTDDKLCSAKTQISTS